MYVVACARFRFTHMTRHRTHRRHRGLLWEQDEQLDEMPSLRFATQTELVVAVGSSGVARVWMRQVIELLGALPPLLVQRGRRATQGGWFEDSSSSAPAGGAASAPAAPQLRRIRLADPHNGSLGVRSLVATVVLLL